jgi:hypothetical protein
VASIAACLVTAIGQAEVGAVLDAHIAAVAGHWRGSAPAHVKQPGFLRLYCAAGLFGLCFTVACGARTRIHDGVDDDSSEGRARGPLGDATARVGAADSPEPGDPTDGSLADASAADAGSRIDAPGNGSIGAACAKFAEMWPRDNCYECMNATRQCGDAWSRLGSECSTRYACAVSHCLCRNGDCPDICGCIGSCLLSPAGRCGDLWNDIFECLASECYAKC